MGLPLRPLLTRDREMHQHISFVSSILLAMGLYLPFMPIGIVFFVKFIEEPQD